MIVAEVIINAITRSVGICEVMEIKAIISQLNTANFIVFFGKISFQDQSIFTQNVIDTPHVFSRFFIFSVVEGVSTVVRTKFLIPASSQYMTALLTVSSIHHRKWLATQY
jgi:hypothetical protein